jgi:hypothetical protein
VPVAGRTPVNPIAGAAAIVISISCVAVSLFGEPESVIVNVGV